MGFRVIENGGDIINAGGGTVQIGQIQPTSSSTEVNITDINGDVQVATVDGGVRLLLPREAETGAHGGAQVYMYNSLLDITDDAGPHDVASITLDEMSSYWIRATVQGFSDDGALANFYVRFAGAYRFTGGAAVVQGVTALATIETNTECDVTLVASGNDVVLRITSSNVISDTIFWTWLLEFQKTGSA